MAGSPSVRSSDASKADKKKRYIIIIIIGVGLDLTLTILTGMELFYITNEGTATRPNTRVCLPCLDLTIHPDDELANVYLSEQNASLCCAESTDKIQSVVEQFVARRVNFGDTQDEQPHKECPPQGVDTLIDDKKPEVPSINVVGKLTKTEIDRSKSFTPLTWDINSDIQHQNGPISYEGDYVIVAKSGMYNVYAQATFNHTNTSSKKPYSLAIYKWMNREADEDMIADSRHSECRDAADNENHDETEKYVTSYVSIVYYLDYGTHVRVKVHTAGDLVAGPHLNYFGMHILH